MPELGETSEHLPAQQWAIQAACRHPTGTFMPFTPEAVELSIPARFEQQVALYPHCLAVTTRQHTLTYAALNTMANRIAHAILAQCGDRAEPIALLFSQETAAIAALLGVLKAGKFYVPLEPAHPQERLTTILDDIQTGLLVTDTPHHSLAAAIARPDCHILDIATIDSRVPAHNPALALTPDTLAYVLYTSGSTGRPKGVMENHRNVLQHMLRVTNHFHVCPADRQTLLRSYSFNGAVRDIFGTLLNGASLHALRLDLEGVAQLGPWLLQEEITLYRSVISVFRQFASTLNGTEQFPRLRLIHVGGEAVSSNDVALYKRHFAADCVFVNGLGITEAGSVRHYFINMATPVVEGMVPVGYAVDGMDVLILDDTGQQVSGDATGEIVVKSRYLSPGYWHRPDLTAAAFTVDAGGGAERLYHTGDLGRLFLDGCLVHLGRRDFQVKVSGHRVETVEIETALLELDTVQHAYVTLREVQPGDQRLVAYVVPATPSAPTSSALRRALAHKLPDYMIPSAFVLLETLPLTAHGKVDRQALPLPGRTRPTLDRVYVSPRTPLEQRLGQLWAEVLELDQVGIHDPFLELGGNSLLAMQLVGRVCDTFHLEVPLQTLFEGTTVADMVALMVQSLAAQHAPDEVACLLAAVEAMPDIELPQSHQ